MAKFETEGYCPCIWVPRMWNENTDNRLSELWSIIGSSIVYEKEDEHKCNPNTESCDEVFGKDVIAYDVMSAIVKKNAAADKILVHQLHDGKSCTTQSHLDIQKVLIKAENPELIVHAGSNFVVILADADYGLDVWIWDLRFTW